MDAALDKTMAALGSSDARSRMSARESLQERERYGEAFREAGFDDVTSRIMARKAQVLQERYDLSRGEAGGEVLHEYQDRRPAQPSAPGVDGAVAGAAAAADVRPAVAHAREQAAPERAVSALRTPATHGSADQMQGGRDSTSQPVAAGHGGRGQAAAQALRGGTQEIACRRPGGGDL